ncbi:AraC family transcriptional regulator [Novipirellula sp. SH528]|uniref:AraC family transcriptional regulator n=1 Tax=Novipirellula sp. SH528 TaxID=3454466 RepID=UPI003FA11ACB
MTKLLKMRPQYASFAGDAKTITDNPGHELPMHRNPPIRDHHILGERTDALAVRCNDRDQRQWIASSPVSHCLADFGIAHCGIMNAFHPFEVMRSDQSGTFFFACLEGVGQVLIDGEWRTVSAGQACVQPPFIPNAMKAANRDVWKFCWVRFQAASKPGPPLSLHAPALAPLDARSLRCAIEGLHCEASGAASTHAMLKWADIVHQYFRVFAEPFREHTRLIHVWNQVECHLADNWTLDQLAEFANMSKEHLRRLCTRSLGRSPMQHVTYLRMHRAAERLMTTDDSVTQIAEQVGYANPFAFSDAFKRWLGCRPSKYRHPRTNE